MYRQRNGGDSIICRELLAKAGVQPTQGTQAQARTEGVLPQAPLPELPHVCGSVCGIYCSPSGRAAHGLEGVIEDRMELETTGTDWRAKLTVHLRTPSEAMPSALVRLRWCWWSPAADNHVSPRRGPGGSCSLRRQATIPPCWSTV